MKLAIRNDHYVSPIEESFNKIFEELFITPVYRNEIRLVPAIEITNDEKNYYLRAELPGIEKNELDIQVNKNSVTISGETKTQNELKEENVCRTEFRYGKFIRTIPLEEEIDHKKANAKYENGILTVTLPRNEEGSDTVIKLKL